MIDDENRSTTDVDVLKLLDLNPADVELTKNGVHAHLKVFSTGDVITLDDQFCLLRKTGASKRSGSPTVPCGTAPRSTI